MILKIKKIVNDFLFPVKCISCGKQDYILCNQCKNNVKIFNKGFCFLCLKKREDFSVCPNCKQNTFLDGVFVLGDYRDFSLKKLIWDLKFNFIKDSAEPLLSLLSERFKDLDKNNFTVTFVPLHEKRLKQRGFNQSEIIANNFAKKFNLRYENVLQRSRDTESQKDLTRFERKVNMEKAFNTIGKVDGKNFYIIDDVITTGATLDACAKVLKKNGAKQVWGVVLARD